VRLAFMGTPEFATPALRALIDAGHEIAVVYTQPPRPAGRGKALRPSSVHRLANELGLDVTAPERFRAPEAIASFAAADLDAAVVVAYGQILPQAALDATRLGCLNLHASLLPRWRGAAPIQRAIMAGDAVTGIAVMQMTADLDTGPIWAEARTEIGPDDTAGSLHDRLAEMGARLIVATLPRIAGGDDGPRPQATAGATRAAKIDKAEARIDWARPAAEVDRLIRGLSPVPGAWCEIFGRRVKLLASRAEEGAGRPGEALDDRLLVACGTGAVRLLRLQRAGKGPVGAAEFLNGTPTPAGARLA